MTATEGTEPLERRTAAVGQVRTVLWVILGLMILQGVLGIYLNLFVSLPIPSDPNAVFPIVFSTPILAVHFLNALALIGATAFMVQRAGVAELPGTRVWGLLLIAAFVVAAYSGYHFTGTQENYYSFAMEMGFFAALVLVVVLIHRIGVTEARERIGFPATG